MGNFNRDRGPRRDFGGGNRGGGNFGGGRRSFGGGGRDRGPREMFNTVCSNCGKDCQVPFRPTGEKPVYCSDCFEKMGGGGDRNPRFEDRGSRRPEFQNRSEQKPQDNSQMDAISRKLDRIIDMLSKSSSVKDAKPVIAEKKPEVKKPVEVKEEKLVVEAAKPEQEVKVEKAPKKAKTSKKKTT